MQFASELQALLASEEETSVWEDQRSEVETGQETWGSMQEFWTDSRPGTKSEGSTDVCAHKSRKYRDAYIFQ